MNLPFKNIKLNKQERIFVLIAGVLCLAFLVLEVINGRNQFWDFQVYYGAANDFIMGKSPYDNYYGLESGYFKYSPFVLILFSPLALLPYGLASTIFFILISVASISLILKIFRFLHNKFSLESSWTYIPLWLMTFMILAHLVRELHLGNVNMILLLLFFYAFNLLEKKKELMAGLVIAIGILVKPHFVILIPLLFLRARWKTLGSFFFCLLAFIALPALINGWPVNELMHLDWLTTMSKHNQSLVESPNTIYGLVSKLQGGLGIESSDKLIIILLATVALCVFLLFLRNNYLQKIKDPLSHYFEYFLLIALIPSLTHTDTEHFLWTLPLLALLLFMIVNKGERNIRLLLLIVLIISTIPWYLNSPDILGQETAIWMDKGGWIGLSNLMIIGLSTFFFLRRGSKSAS